VIDVEFRTLPHSRSLAALSDLIDRFSYCVLCVESNAEAADNHRSVGGRHRFRRRGDLNRPFRAGSCRDADGRVLSELWCPPQFKRAHHFATSATPPTSPCRRTRPAIATTGRADYSARVRVDEGRTGHLADAIVRALLKLHYFRAKVSEKELSARLGRLIVENLKAEQALEAEAERLAERHARQMLGMDQRKVIEGIKARLAKERGFTL